MRKIYLLICLMFIFFTNSIFALTNGDYYSSSQQGMMVYMYDGYYELYLNNDTYETGEYTINNGILTFQPDWKKTGGELTATTGSVKNDCSFTWGASGEFINNKCGGSSDTGNNNNNLPSNYTSATLDANYNLIIPCLNLGEQYWYISMQLSSYYYPYLFTLTDAYPTSYSSNCASYNYNQYMLYIPQVKVGDVYYDVYLQLYTTTPNIVFNLYNAKQVPGGSSDYYNNQSSSEGGYTTSDLYGCYSPENTGWLSYYCFDGQGGYYLEDWTVYSGCTGALEQGTYQVQGTTLTMCDSSGCSNHTIQPYNGGILVDGKPYATSNGCN